MIPRSYLYVPGDRPDRYQKALDSGTDAVILDLEDAVPVGGKDEARASVASFVGSTAAEGGGGGAELWVRINDGETGEADLGALDGAARLHGVLVPKATVPAVARAAARAARVSILVESGAGLLEMATMAAVPGASHLGLGEADLVADLGMDPSPDERELWPVRVAVVVASAAAGLLPPTGPVSIDFRDLDALARSTDLLRRGGFGARACIHPAQVATVNAVFTPSPEQVDRAAALIAGHETFLAGGRAVSQGADGRLVDEALVRAARRTLDRAGVVPAASIDGTPFH